MTMKFQRPAGSYAGASGLANRTKYQDDANAVPKRAISSSKVDGDLNYVIDALNELDSASGTRASIGDRLDVCINPDGTLKASVTAALDDFVVQASPGTLARVDNVTLSMNGGNFTAIYKTNRRIKVSMGATVLVGDVVSSAYGGGVTTIVCADLVDSNGTTAVISSTPTQVAYSPLVPGSFGNTMRRVDVLKLPASGAVYELAPDSGDFVLKRDGSVLARFGNTGMVSGLAAGSVGQGALASDITARLMPSGVVAPFAGTTAPNGWLMCFGQAVSRTTYADLFTAIGTAYGNGDGSTTFNLPDMRGRVAFGLDNMGGADAARLSVSNTLGGAGGSQTKTASTDGYALTVNDIPPHTHSMRTDVSGFGSGGGSAPVNATTTGGTIYTGSVGGGAAHSHAISNLDVMPPYILMNYIVKV